MICKLKVPVCPFENNNFPCLLLTLIKIKINTMPDLDIEHKSSQYITTVKLDLATTPSARPLAFGDQVLVPPSSFTI